MRIRETIRCPYCRNALHVMERTPKTYSQGCPLKKCPHCQNTYLDMRCKEQALKPYRKVNYLSNLFYALCVSVPLCIFAFVIITIIVPEDYTGLVLKIFFLAVTVALWGLTCIGQNKNANKLKKSWDESDVRLKNVEYAKMLANAGFSVPAHYLPKDFSPSPSLLNILKM